MDLLLAKNLLLLLLTLSMMMALFTSVSAALPSVSVASLHHTPRIHRRFSLQVDALSSSSSSSSFPDCSPAKSVTSSSTPVTKKPLLGPSRPPDPSFNNTISNPNSNPVIRLVPSAESSIEKVIFDFRFLALLAVGGSLAGSLLCFLNGCVYIFEAYRVYWTGCLKGIHTGQMVLQLVEAIDVYLAGTVMLIFGMGLYGLFISNVPPDVPPTNDRALKGSSLFGMFTLKERPKWMKISSLDELKTKVGHVIVMILLVKMLERSKMVTIATGMDLLSYSVCIFLSSASLYILHNLHNFKLRFFDD
ncbi:uncharacterized protein LOC122641893 [Telopea speciosissima]|uniref:uncharacterized protein LOC122641893 n=1 Tax=Telopea speciosissima TaxID=54955 RepID=UPI001CC6FDD9|nr:uncharacterized protein LOC122641893 [Telopea speciosissima]